MLPIMGSKVSISSNVNTMGSALKLFAFSFMEVLLILVYVYYPFVMKYFYSGRSYTLRPLLLYRGFSSFHNADLLMFGTDEYEKHITIFSNCQVFLCNLWKVFQYIEANPRVSAETHHLLPLTRARGFTLHPPRATISV